MASNYGNLVYWEERYKKTPGERFDWLLTFDALKSLLLTYIPSTEASILYVGCGTSELADKLCDAGYSNVTCIDASKEAVKQQIEGSKKRQRLEKLVPKFKCMDVMHLDFQKESFDVVLDKGTLDSILCGEDYLRKCLKSLREISRVLKQGGIYLMFSYESPGKRIYYLRNRLTKFAQVDYFPIDKFQVVRNQANKNLNQSKDDARTVVSRTSVVDRKKRTHYCYVCTRTEGLEIKKNNQNIIEQDKQDQQQLEASGQPSLVSQKENQMNSEVELNLQSTDTPQINHDNEQPGNDADSHVITSKEEEGDQNKDQEEGQEQGQVQGQRQGQGKEQEQGQGKDQEQGQYSEQFQEGEQQQQAEQQNG